MPPLPLSHYVSAIAAGELFLTQRFNGLNPQAGTRWTERGDEADQDHRHGDDGKNDGALALENPIALVDYELVQGDGAEQSPRSAGTELTERAGKDADQQAITIRAERRADADLF